MDKSAAPNSTAPKCDICGRPVVGRNHCNTCGKDVCRACYVTLERKCRYCFGTTLDLDAAESAPETAGSRTGLELQKKKGCLGGILLFIGVLLVALVLLRVR